MNKLKEINGKYYQECEIVMLASDKNLKIGDLGLSANNILWNIKESNFKEADVLYECVPQHLYFLSNGEIKLGDWYFDDCLDKPRKCLTDDKQYWSVRKDYKKIIATTDTSLLCNNDGIDKDCTLFSYNQFKACSVCKFKGLLQPSSEFIQAYIKAYNEIKQIGRASCRERV